MSDFFNGIKQFGREHVQSAAHNTQKNLSDVQAAMSSMGADAKTIELVLNYLSSIRGLAVGTEDGTAKQAIISHVSDLVKQSIANNGMTGSMFTKEQARAGADGINFETYLQALAPYPVEEWFVSQSYPLPAPKGTKRMGGTPPDALREYSHSVVPYSGFMGLHGAETGARAQKKAASDSIFQLNNTALQNPLQAALMLEQVLSKYADANGNILIHGEERELLVQRLNEINRQCNTGGESSGYAVKFIGCALSNGYTHVINWLEKCGLPPDDGGEGSATREAIITIFDTRYGGNKSPDPSNVESAKKLNEQQDREQER